jgi:SIR2-like domain
LIQKGQRFDIEVILTALTILLDSSLIKNYLAPFLGISDIAIPQPRSDLLPLLEETRKQLYRRCMDFERGRASEIYNKLSNRLSKMNIYRVLFTKTEGGELLDEFSPSITHNVFTTNYDPIYETYLRSNDIDYSDGFTLDHQDPSFSSAWDHNKIELAKLHGSIDYYLRENDEKVLKYSFPTDETDVDIFGERLKQRMMILPIGEKYVTRTPYLQLLQKFREDLVKEEIIIIIGYSFRDDPINNAIMERIYQKKRVKIVVVSPNARDLIVQSLPAKFQNVSVPVNTNFGNESSIDEISNAVVNRQCGDGF